MLHRATRRRDALRYFQQSSEQLLLPWLCPALLRHQSRVSAHLPIKRTPSTSTATSSRRPLPQTSRGLATARVDAYVHDDHYVPFAASDSQQSYSHLTPFDASKLLYVEEANDQLPVRMRRGRAFGGTAEEARSTFDACLRVHRFERAQALLTRLAMFFPPGAGDVQDACNEYIGELVDAIASYQKRENLAPLQKFFEFGMRQLEISPDQATYALMIRAALSALDGPKRDRTIRRYWHLAREGGFENLVQVLSPHELGQLQEICPTDIRRSGQAMEMNFEEPDTEPAAEARSQIEVHEVSQRGLGMSSLRQSLSLFSEVSDGPMPTNPDLSPREQEEEHATIRQARLEQDAVQSALERWRKEAAKLKGVGIDSLLQRKAIGVHLWDWHQLLTARIQEELKLVEEAEAMSKPNAADRERCEYGPFLRLLLPDRLAAICILASLGVMSKTGVDKGLKLTRLVVHLGKTINEEVYAEIARQRILDSMTSSQAGLKEQVLKDKTYSRTRGGVQQKRFIAPAVADNKHALRWPLDIHVKVGAILSSLLFDVAKMTVSKEDPESGHMLHSRQAVFQHTYKYDKGRRIGHVQLHPAMVELLLREPAGPMLAKHLPMVCKPRPWKGFQDGGFLGYPVPALRIKDSDRFQLKYAEAAAQRGDLDQMFQGLDILGQTAWKINRGVFNVMLQAWNSGKAIANLPELEPDLPHPEQPSDFQTDPFVRGKWYRAVQQIDNKKSGMHSNRCFQNFQMEIAKAYLDETFYLPHNVDFRGRAYPIPPYLNQMGADNCRGLLIFGKGKPLGSNGLRWLKIHLANVYGYDKASLSEREDFATAHLADIYDSAINALDGERWWLKAEDPWQCLAACMEIRNALESPEPTAFISHFPVHQDGSCNGLQHYAALGGDLAGAQQVNLEPGDRPSDVYTGVAELVKADIKLEAAEGIEIARFLEGRITRKVVKQTVMTNVYGVTFLGAIRQVRHQLEDLMPELGQEGGLGFGVVATYVARKIFKALGALFTGAHEIQFWLGDCATRISTSVSSEQVAILHERRMMKQEASDEFSRAARGKAGSRSPAYDPVVFRSSVIWTTPLKLPVVQPYRTSKARRVHTNLQDISIKEPNVQNSVNKRKQLQAFPPNFIHSLDATHMILSAIKCDEMGLSFAAVHDSFWTHAADLNVMNEVLRDAFIRMHSEDVVGRLAEEFEARYRGYLYLAQIDSSSSVGKRIRTMRRNARPSMGYGSANRRENELLAEWERQKLLSSEVATERAKGAEMVTPASIFEALDGEGKENILVEKHSLGETAIGHIPKETSDQQLEKALAESDVDVDLESTLNPLTDSDADDSFDMPEQPSLSTRSEETCPELEEIEGTAKDEQPEEELRHAQNKRGGVLKKAKTKAPNIWLWLPLKFPAVPKKGDFDVSRLKDSQYFFS